MNNAPTRPNLRRLRLLPVSHTEQQAHIEIVLDQNGKFQRAALVNRETTVCSRYGRLSRTYTNSPAASPLRQNSILRFGL